MSYSEVLGIRMWTSLGAVVLSITVPCLPFFLFIMKILLPLDSLYRITVRINMRMGIEVSLQAFRVNKVIRSVVIILTWISYEGFIEKAKA